MKQLTNESMPETEEELKPDSEVLDFNNPDFKFFPKGRHIYRQQGYYLICKSCELQHAVWIGPDKMMVGEDKEGNPILKRRESAS